MKQHKPTLPAAHLALYGDHTAPQPPTEQEFIALFRQLSGANKDRCINYLNALATGDQSTVDAMRREIEIEQAYLQRTDTREQLAADLLEGRTPESLQETITALLHEQDSAGGAA